MAACFLQALPSYKGSLFRTSPQGNCVLLLGLPEDIQATAPNDVIRFKPSTAPPPGGARSPFPSANAGRSSGPPIQLSEKLTDIPGRAEGYALPQPPNIPVGCRHRTSLTARANDSWVVFFAGDQKTLAHIEEWAAKPRCV